MTNFLHSSGQAVGEHGGLPAIHVPHSSCPRISGFARHTLGNTPHACRKREDTTFFKVVGPPYRLKQPSGPEVFLRSQ